MNKNSKAKLDSIKKHAMSVGGSILDIAKTTIDTGITLAEEGFKYYDKHKSTINRLLILAATGSFILPGLKGGNSNQYISQTHGAAFYDETLKTYVYAKRELSLYELNEVARRHKSGENYRTILMSMGLLSY